MTDRPADHITLARRVQKPEEKAKPTGLQEAVLEELRLAAVTFEYLRAKDDPVEFWEALRLARSQRAFSPGPDGGLPTPSSEDEKAVRQELDLVRTRYAELVGELRDFLESTPDLPQPAERLELAVAFLMASSREPEAVAGWLKNPEANRARAASKLRSLAAITDPYCQALLPWSLAAYL